MISIAIWVLLAILALLAGVASVSAFSGLTNDLPDPTTLEHLPIQQQSVIYDRTGKVELATVGQTHRDLTTWAELAENPIIVDAQTAVEDKTFWDNSGFDPLAIVSAGIDSFRGRSRGASTITQQLVRQRLLDPALVQDPKRQLERKFQEIVQSIRLTQAFPGEEGKQTIITAYLNQNYYGNQTYGVKAAAKAYFGKDLKDLTIAEAAILAGLPKSPSNYDLVKNASTDCSVPVAADGTCAGKETLVVPPTTDIVKRRNMILDLLAEGDRNPLTEGQYTSQDFLNAKNDPVILAPQQTPRWVAPHFVWAVQKELADKLCGVDVPTCDQLEAGGLRVTTTLDVNLQKIAEKWVKAAALIPNSNSPQRRAQELGLKYQPWMKNLRGKDLHNGALVATDYQTGQIVAYVGSAEYYATASSPAFQPQFDVAGSGWRQPGSAFKPFNYLTGVDDKTMTAATMFMDSATDFGGNYSPNDADNLERGPVRVRNALQFSLNIPSVKATVVNTPEHLFARAKDYGMTFQTDTPSAGPALGLGVQEVHPVDLTTAYGTLANGGKYVPHTTIISITDASGKDVPITQPDQTQAASPQAAYIITDILAGNTNPKVNPFWGKFELKDASGKHRPATLKTGTNNDAKDLNAYGFIAPPTAEGRAAGQFALVAGVWNGNSDNSLVSTPQKPVFSIDVTTYVWQGFMEEATKSWPITNFANPGGITKAKIDPFTGAHPAPGAKSVDELFIAGTAPVAEIPAGECGVAALAHVGFEKDHPQWLKDAGNWFGRAEKGPGTRGGVNRTRTAFFYNRAFKPYGNSWGIVVGFGCKGTQPSPTCIPLPTPDASGVVPSFEIPTPNPSASGIAAIPCPPASPAASAAPSESVPPSAPPSEPPAPTPTPTPTPTPKPPPPTPTPTPTPAATPAGSPAAPEQSPPP
jgi:membrane peptidoglycan carboxypeptidase